MQSLLPLPSAASSFGKLHAPNILSEPSEENIFTSQRCYTEPKIFHAHTLTITIGYLIFDFVLCAFVVKDFTALGYQTYFHHIGAITSFLLVLFLDNHGAYLITAIGNQFTEISTPFMHFRQMLFIHKDLPNHAKIETVNIVLFLISFLFGRFIFQIRLSYTLIKWLTIEYSTNVSNSNPKSL